MLTNEKIQNNNINANTTIKWWQPESQKPSQQTILQLGENGSKFAESNAENYTKLNLDKWIKCTLDEKRVLKQSQEWNLKNLDLCRHCNLTVFFCKESILWTSSEVKSLLWMVHYTSYIYNLLLSSHRLDWYQIILLGDGGKIHHRSFKQGRN